MSFGERLQAVRRRNEMTQEEFAAQLKVSRQAVSKWESSRGYPEIEKIIYICNRYGTTMDCMPVLSSSKVSMRFISACVSCISNPLGSLTCRWRSCA